MGDLWYLCNPFTQFHCNCQKPLQTYVYTQNNKTINIVKVVSLFCIRAFAKEICNNVVVINDKHKFWLPVKGII